MENLTIDNVMRLLHPLSMEVKLEILTRLATEVKQGLTRKKPTKKEQLLQELFGAWKDVDDNLITEILQSRTVSRREINLD